MTHHAKKFEDKATDVQANADNMAMIVNSTLASYNLLTPDLRQQIKRRLGEMLLAE